MRTNNLPSYLIVFRQASGRDVISTALYTSRAEAKRVAQSQCASDETAEVCELTTVYEVEA